MFYHRDPIFEFTRQRIREYYLMERIASLNRQLSDGREIIAYWVDGMLCQEFFAGNYSKKLALTNNIVQASAEQSRHIHTVNHTYYGMYYCEYPNLDLYTVIQKDFNCFMNRYDIFRQSWLYQLIKQNLFDLGFISFNSEISGGKQPPPFPEIPSITGTEAFDYGFKKHNSIFAAEHEFIKSQIPYKNFIDSGDLTPVVMSSKFSLILETWFHDNSVLTFSEKTFRCLQLPRPWMLFSTQYAIKQLRNWGFDVLDDVVDHSYDLIANNVERQLAILAETQKLINLNIDIARCVQASQHNQAILKSWDQCWSINMHEDLDQAYQKALSL